MQRRSFLSAAAAAAILMQGHAMAAPAVVGQSAPGFTLTDTAGKPVRLATRTTWRPPRCRTSW